MFRSLAVFALMICPLSVAAKDTQTIVADVVQGHVLPRYATLEQEATSLAQVSLDHCDPVDAALREQFHSAFDAWMAVSHLRFGPSEVQNRAFALAFWPDSRGATPRTLSGLFAEKDPIAADPEAYAQVSIAARGFYALEFLLFDDAFDGAEHDSYQCQLIQTVTADIAATAGAIYGDWQGEYADQMTAPTAQGPYRSDTEAAQELFKALSAGLQFTAETRLGRPLGTFDQPRPNRADARRSGRSLANVVAALTALEDLALRLAGEDTVLSDKLSAAFDHSLGLADQLDDPVFAGVAEPQSRLRVEVLQQSVEEIRDLVRVELGPTLGVAAGFNALDGD